MLWCCVFRVKKYKKFECALSRYTHTHMLHLGGVRALLHRSLGGDLIDLSLCVFIRYLCVCVSCFIGAHFFSFEGEDRLCVNSSRYIIYA